MCIEDIDELEGVFNFCKIFEYDTSMHSIKEIVSFNNSVCSWYFWESNNSLYWYDYEKECIISQSLTTQFKDTVLNQTDSIGNLDYVEEGGRLCIISSTKQRIIKYIISADNSLTKVILGTPGPYKGSYRFNNIAYRDNYFVETYSDQTKEFGIIMHSPKKNTKKLIEFINYNVHWLDDENFTIQTKNSLIIFDNNLDTVMEYKKYMLHVIEAFPDCILTSCRENGQENYVLYSRDFKLSKNIDILEEPINLLYVGQHNN